MVRCWSASLGPLIEVRMDFSQVTYAWLSAVGSTCVHGGWTALTAGGVEPWNDVDVSSLHSHAGGTVPIPISGPD